MQSVARLVARSARSSAEHNCSRRKLASTARCGGGGGTKEEILKVPQSSAATMAEPAAGDAAARSRTASQVAAGIAQGERKKYKLPPTPSHELSRSTEYSPGPENQTLLTLNWAPVDGEQWAVAGMARWTR
uniref:Uncharacterized protein n=1 Tax=Oryza rufipogon TaxID=4529 RepID=A0A0E0MZJ6_ORYRU